MAVSSRRGAGHDLLARRRHALREDGSPDAAISFIQFWILPSAGGLETRVQQRQYRIEDRSHRSLRIIGPQAPWVRPRDRMPERLVSHISTDRRHLTHASGRERGGYLYVIDGRSSSMATCSRRMTPHKIVGDTSLTLRTDVAAEKKLILIDVPLELSPLASAARTMTCARS